MRKRFVRFMMILLGVLPAKNIIVFESFFGKQFSDNPKAIYDYLINSSDYDGYRLIWSVKYSFEKEFIKHDCEYVTRGSLRWIILMARAKYWINNTRQPSWIVKNKHTIYLQTWHGTPLKKLGMDIENVRMPGTNTEKYRVNFIRDTKKWDVLLAQNEYAARIFENAFQFKSSNIMTTGYPRNDKLVNYNKDEILEIKKKLKLPLNKKIILYAPTWKDNESYRRGEYKASMKMNLKQMKEALSNEYVLLIKWHYLIADNIEIEKDLSDFAIKLPQTMDISNCYLISDLLITDYSSVFFDYAVLCRPIIFYTPDWDEYQKEIRGMYEEVSKALPGPIVENTTELITSIIEKSPPSIAFLSTFCTYEDGKSSERVVEKVIMKNSSIHRLRTR